MSNLHENGLWLLLVPLLVGLMFYFIIRHRGKHLVQIILAVVVLLIMSPFLYLAYGLGGVGGVVEVVCVLLVGSGIGIYVLPCLLVGKLANPLGDMFDGGNEPPDAAPFYYVAKLRRKERKFDEAISRIEQQLELFPTDLEGQMLLAEILAEDLQDLTTAEETVGKMAAQDCHPPKLVAEALNKLADWQLTIGNDDYSARITLRKIVDLFPNTNLAQSAAARLSSLG